MQIKDNIDEIFALYERFGAAKYDGEEVTQLQHALQCAQLAESEKASTATILGAFLHDIGHLLQGEGVQLLAGGLGTQRHDVIGAEYLSKRGFPKDVTDFAGGHVNAKRYLVFKDAGYYERLSDCSKLTLIQQGGAMESNEAEEFEKNPRCRHILRMRHWDEQAKVVDKVTPSMEYYKRMCVDYLT
uniref:HD domain-containing protein n=1 Tax=Ciona savignyi TaxID=51511 RepID=H2YLI9_CIOSA